MPVSRPATSRRGRPRKFSGPARAITLTLPEDTLALLRSVNQDIGLAIVQVARPLAQHAPRPAAELTRFGDQSVIVVTPTRALCQRTGAELVPLPDGRALLAFDDQTSVAQFELRLLDALDDPTLPLTDRETFAAVARILSGSRRDGNAKVKQRNIIVLHEHGPKPGLARTGDGMDTET